MMGNFSLKNKIIIITGASSGIGKECAINFAKEGAKLIIMGRNKERLDDTVLNLYKMNEHERYYADLTDFKKISKIITDLKKKDIIIDGIVNVAGISTTLPFRFSKPEKVNNLYNINVTSGFNLVREVIYNKLFNKNGASVIFISSVMGFLGEKGKTIYSLSKGAIIAGTKSLAVEFANKKIRVNSVSPGVVVTPLSSNSIYSQKEDSLNAIKALHPLGLGYPNDIANACQFLLSDASRWITGSNLIIDGGYSAK